MQYLVGKTPKRYDQRSVDNVLQSFWKDSGGLPSRESLEKSGLAQNDVIGWFLNFLEHKRPEIVKGDDVFLQRVLLGAETFEYLRKHEEAACKRSSNETSESTEEEPGLEKLLNAHTFMAQGGQLVKTMFSLWAKRGMPPAEEVIRTLKVPINAHPTTEFDPVL